MRKAILILVVLLLAVIGVAQSPKRKPQRKTRPPQSEMSPCGIPIPTIAEFMEELKVKWRDIAHSEKLTWYYNTQNQVCEKGILKVWIKSVQSDTSAYSIDKLEINCRSNESRAMSTVNYRKDGTVADSFTVRDPKWEEVTPDSVGEIILQTLCVKDL